MHGWLRRLHQAVLTAEPDFFSSATRRAKEIQEDGHVQLHMAILDRSLDCLGTSSRAGSQNRRKLVVRSLGRLSSSLEPGGRAASHPVSDPRVMTGRPGRRARVAITRRGKRGGR